MLEALDTSKLNFNQDSLLLLNLADTKTLTIETGIQNSGLALVLIFTYFEGLGGMAIIAAWWGIWHIISGMTIASIWMHFSDPVVPSFSKK